MVCSPRRWSLRVALVAALATACVNIPPPGALSAQTLAVPQPETVGGDVSVGGIVPYPIPYADLQGGVRVQVADFVVVDARATFTGSWWGLSPGVLVHTGRQHRGLHFGGRVGGMVGTGDLLGFYPYIFAYAGVDARLQLAYGWGERGAWGLTAGAATSFNLGDHELLLPWIVYPSVTTRVDVPLGRASLLIALGWHYQIADLQLGVSF